MTDYKRDSRGFLVRTTPKTFRRGRIRWTGGRSVTSVDPTGGKKGLTAPRSEWVGATAHDPKRVKVHVKK